MFISKYVNDFYFDLIVHEYEEQYLNSLDKENFSKIYTVFKDNGFYFIEDIILKYLEIFSMDYDDVFKGIKLLKEKLGNNFVSIVGNDMNYLNTLLEMVGEGE